MKVLYSIVLSVLALQVASCTVQLVPQPFCICGTTLKLATDPVVVNGVNVAGPLDPVAPQRLRTLQIPDPFAPWLVRRDPSSPALRLNSPTCTMCDMKREYLQRYDQPWWL